MSACPKFIDMLANFLHLPGVKDIFLTSGVMLLITYSTMAQNQASPCKLLQPSELESALGGKAGNFSEQSLGKAHVCMGQVGTLKISIRVAERTSEKGSAPEQKGIETLKGRGWKIELNTTNDLTVSTAIPPANESQYGYNTTASIFKNGRVLAVEATALKKEEMASKEAVTELVKKAYERLPK